MTDRHERPGSGTDAIAASSPAGRLVDSLPAAVYQCRFDASGHRSFPYLNRETGMLCGLPQDAASTADDVILAGIPEESREDCRRALAEANRTGGPWSLEFPFVTADGRRLRLRDRARPFLDEDGQPAWSGLLTEITADTTGETPAGETDRVLSEHIALFQEEKRLAKSIIDHLLEYGLQDEPHIRQWARAADTFNGDIIATTRSRKGDIYVLFADASGHGLSAAVSAIPLIPLFFRVAQIGLPIEAVARDLNQSLKQSLPPGRFVCAALVSLKPGTGHFRLWNAGMPKVLHIGRSGNILASIQPTNLPLGVADWHFDAHSSVGIHSSPGDRLLLVSDGITESTDGTGTLFGEEGVRRVVEHTGEADLIEALRDAVLERVGDQPIADDMSILELRDTR